MSRRPGRERRFSETFTPRMVPGVVMWLDADLGVTLNAGNISAWADQSGNGNDLTQGTPAAQPLYLANWRNGRAAMQSAPGDILQRVTWAGGSISQPTTIYLVGQNSASESLASGVYFSAGAAFHSGRVISGVPSALCTGNASISGTVTDSAAFISRWNMNGASTAIRVEQHGQPLLSGTCNPGNTAMNGLTLGGNYDNTFNPSIVIQSCLVVNGTVSPENEAKLLAFFRGRAAIQGA